MADKTSIEPMKILSALDLDEAAKAVPGRDFLCADHPERNLVARWCGKRRLVVFWCPDCPPADCDRMAVRVM